MDIAYKSESKFFGIHITKNLKWMAHVLSLSLQVSKVLYLIKSLKKIMSSCMIRSIYHSKFQSLLRYGTIFWWWDNENIVILKLNKGVIRMFGVGTGTSCRQLLKDYKTLTVTFWYVPEVVCIMKMYNFSMEQNVHIHDYNTRKKMDLNVLLCNSNLFKESVISMGIQSHNKVPVSI